MSQPFNTWTGLANLVGGGSVQIGAADNATPVARTFTAESVIGGTSNVAGAPLTFRGSLGTGTGAPGAMNFGVGPVGVSSGSTQNAAVNVLQLLSGGNQGSDSSTNVLIAPTWNTSGTPTALKINPTNTASGGSSLLADFQLGGVSKHSIREDGLVFFAGGQFWDQNGNITTNQVNINAGKPNPMV
jgi:hypothetical protein